MSEKENSTTKRFRMLDLLRGFTVFFMILSHSIYFFHNDTNPILIFIEKFGNTVCFTSFLLVSAATAHIAYFSKEDNWEARKPRLIKRILVLLGGYYLLAFLVFLSKIISSHGFERLNLIFNITTLRDLAPFGEFFIPFIFLPLLVLSFPKVFKRILSSLFLTVAVGFGTYFLGVLLYEVNVWSFVTPWKALLAGSEGFFRFPLLQYFPVYLAGLYWGRWLPKINDLKHQKEIATSIISASFFGISLAVLGFFLLGRDFEGIITRWPPSIPFILIGTGFASFISFLTYKTKQLRNVPLIRDFFLILGQNAFDLALVHVLLLQVYSLAGGLKTGSITIFIISFIVLMILALAVAAVVPFNLRFALNCNRGACTEHDLENSELIRFEEELITDIEKDVEKTEQYFFFGKKQRTGSKSLIRKRHILGASLTFALAAFVVVPPIYQEINFRNFSNKKIDWSEDSFGYRQRILLENKETLAEIPDGLFVSYPLNHLELVKSKKSLPNAADLKILYWDGKKAKEVESFVEGNPNQAETTLTFEIQKRIKPGEVSQNYFLYYGNNLAEKNPPKASIKKTKSEYSIEVQAEEKYPLLLTVDRRWSILTDDPAVPKTLRFSLHGGDEFKEGDATYTVSGAKIKGKMERTDSGLWEGVIETSELKPGQYILEGKLKNGDSVTYSQRAGFFVSYPLYISWTQDWEGYDVSEVYLSAMDQVSKQHGVKMTHFWNPRLNTTQTVSTQRKTRLTNWVKQRRDNLGETIQLHLHMFYDFVTLSGVTPKKTPNWGDQGDGYGTPTTAYNQAEMENIIRKGLDTMETNNLGRPTIYRAGGWFANTDTLKAIEAVGMLADSSGRTKYKLFSTPGPWDLPANAQPYYPSKENQNSGSGETLSILEIPNNGADSYWFSSDEMKNRFYANYPGGILIEPKQITYLSHPHWFNKKEQDKVESLFNLIDTAKYESDYGPAIYVTLDEIYNVWSKR